MKCFVKVGLFHVESVGSQGLEDEDSVLTQPHTFERLC